MDAVEIFEHLKQVLAKIKAWDDDPKHRSENGRELLKKYQAKSRAYGWEVYHITKQQRILNGETINEAGYTGRNSNRR